MTYPTRIDSPDASSQRSQTAAAAAADDDDDDGARCSRVTRAIRQRQADTCRSQGWTKNYIF